MQTCEDFLPHRIPSCAGHVCWPERCQFFAARLGGELDPEPLPDPGGVLQRGRTQHVRAQKLTSHSVAAEYIWYGEFRMKHTKPRPNDNYRPRVVGTPARRRQCRRLGWWSGCRCCSAGFRPRRSSCSRRRAWPVALNRASPNPPNFMPGLSNLVWG